MGESSFAEQLAREQFEEEGSTVYRNGWPDFLVIDKHGKARLIEIKSRTISGSERLSPAQIAMHRVIKQYLGLDVEVLHIEYVREIELERAETAKQVREQNDKERADRAENVRIAEERYKQHCDYLDAERERRSERRKLSLRKAIDGRSGKIPWKFHGRRK